MKRIILTLLLPLSIARAGFDFLNTEQAVVMTNLGTMKQDLVLWLNMNSLKNSGVGWAGKSVAVTASGPVKTVTAGGRSYMDFRERGAKLRITPAVQLGRTYTLCSWVQFPAPKAHGIVWHGTDDGGVALYLTESEFSVWDAATDKPLAYGKIPKGTTGWHHIAVVADGKATRIFMDGREAGKSNTVPATNVFCIGTHPKSSDHQSWMMSGGLDEQFMFRRALTPEEINRVMRISQPGK